MYMYCATQPARGNPRNDRCLRRRTNSPLARTLSSAALCEVNPPRVTGLAPRGNPCHPGRVSTTDPGVEAHAPETWSRGSQGARVGAERPCLDRPAASRSGKDEKEKARPGEARAQRLRCTSSEVAHPQPHGFGGSPSPQHDAALVSQRRDPRDPSLRVGQTSQRSMSPLPGLPHQPRARDHLESGRGSPVMRQARGRSSLCPPPKSSWKTDEPTSSAAPGRDLSSVWSGPPGTGTTTPDRSAAWGTNRHRLEHRPLTVWTHVSSHCTQEDTKYVKQKPASGGGTHARRCRARWRRATDEAERGMAHSHSPRGCRCPGLNLQTGGRDELISRVTRNRFRRGARGDPEGIRRGSGGEQRSRYLGMQRGGSLLRRGSEAGYGISSYEDWISRVRTGGPDHSPPNAGCRTRRYFASVPRSVPSGYLPRGTGHRLIRPRSRRAGSGSGPRLPGGEQGGQLWQDSIGSVGLGSRDWTRDRLGRIGLSRLGA
ncbi:hypothetical protein JHW43_009513 [Diplocarpon mali]|nr:hypothetical protein JHW43_009513 [Diplocarpon mali]